MIGRIGYVLKPEYQKLADEFDMYYTFRGCTCFISAPCSFCTHEGNPLNLAEDEDAWESELVAAVRHAITEPSGVITKAFPQKGE